MSEATFNATSIQRWCQQQFAGRVTQIQNCLGSQSRMLLALGGKLPPRFVGTLLANSGAGRDATLIASPMPGRVDAPLPGGSVLSSSLSSNESGTGSRTFTSSELNDDLTSVPAVERNQPMSIPSLVSGGISLLSASSGPTAVGAAPPPQSTGAALINIGQSLISSWLSPATTPMAMAMAVPSMAPVMGRMMTAVGGSMLVDAAAGMVGRAVSAGMGMISGANGMRRPSARRARALVRLVGVEVAAMTLGISVPMVAYLATRPGRRRGISARDVRTTRRVVRFACNLSSSLASVRAAPRRRKC